MLSIIASDGNKSVISPTVSGTSQSFWERTVDTNRQINYTENMSPNNVLKICICYVPHIWSSHYTHVIQQHTLCTLKPINILNDFKWFSLNGWLCIWGLQENIWSLQRDNCIIRKIRLWKELLVIMSFEYIDQYLNFCKQFEDQKYEICWPVQFPCRHTSMNQQLVVAKYISRCFYLSIPNQILPVALYNTHLIRRPSQLK